MQLLIERGADIEAKTNHGTTPLLFAVDKGHLSTVALILAMCPHAGADPTSQAALRAAGFDAAELADAVESAARLIAATRRRDVCIGFLLRLYGMI